MASLTPSMTPRGHVPWLFAAICLGVIAVVSLYPLDSWQDNTEPLFDFLFYPLPYYTRRFDTIVNVLAYFPYGFALALIPRQRWLGLLLALMVTSTTSLSVELIQQFLPSRISSNLDLLCNSLGGTLGALFALNPLSRYIGQRLHRWRHRHFHPSRVTDYALLLMTLWFLTQLDPSVPFFGVVVIPKGLPQPFISPLENPALFLFLIEAGSAMLNLLGTLLLVSLCAKRSQSKLRLVLGFLCLATLIKLGIAAAFLREFAFFEWINPRVLLGLLAGLLLLLWWVRLPYTARAGLGAITLGGMLYLAAQWPLQADRSPSFSHLRWSHGHLTNLSLLAEVASHVWPWLALTLCFIGFIRQSLFASRYTG